MSLPRPRLLPTLLALSVVLNLCIAGGLAYSNWILPGQRARQDHSLFRELNLDAAQQRAFLQFRRSVGMQARAMREKVRSLSASVWQHYGEDTPDPARIHALVMEIGADRTEFQNSASDALLGLLAQLKPEQRRQVIDKLEHRAAEMRTGFPTNN